LRATGNQKEKEEEGGKRKRKRKRASPAVAAEIEVRSDRSVPRMNCMEKCRRPDCGKGSTSSVIVSI